MASFQHSLWIGSLIVLLYNVGLYTLLLYSVIDIAVLSCSSSRSLLNLVGLLIIVASVGNTFHGFFLGLGSPTGAFLFVESVLFMSHLVNSFTSFSDLSIYSSLTMTTCFICEAHI